MISQSPSTTPATTRGRNEILPITAIIPVLNCAHRMRQHMEQSMDWLPHVEEILVVDSHSVDDSIAIIQEYAGELKPRIISHPVGIFKSWNHGVTEASCPYIYFSTVGDRISLDGLKKLMQCITALNADVVISPPLFIHQSPAAGSRHAVTRWPVHRIIDELEIQQPTLLEPDTLYDYVMNQPDQSVLSSSASNLYRRSTLMNYPFPEDFHSAGDCAWIIEHNFDTRIAIHPECFSSYLFHSKDWSSASDQDDQPNIQHRLTCKAYLKAVEQHDWTDPEAEAMARHILKNLEAETETPELEGGRYVPTSLMDSQDAETRALLVKLNALCLRVDILSLKKMERRYRAKIGNLRYLWPPSMAVRFKRKKLQGRAQNSRILTERPAKHVLTGQIA